MHSSRLLTSIAAFVLILSSCSKHNDNTASGSSGTTTTTTTSTNPHWQSIQVSGLTSQINDIWFTDSQHGFLCGNDKSIYTSTDKGLTWKINHSFDWVPFSLFFLDASHGYAIGYGYFGYTMDGGITWATKPTPGSTIVYSYDTYPNCQFVTPSTGFVLANKQLYKTTDTGTTWQPVIASQVIAIHFRNATEGYAYSNAKTLSHTTDGGTNWQAQTLATTSSVGSLIFGLIQFTDDQHGWLTDELTVSATTDGGTTWNQVSTPSKPILDMQVFDTQNSIMVTDSLIQRSADGGKTWTIDNAISPSPTLYCIAYTDSTHIWIGANKGILYKYNP